MRIFLAAGIVMAVLAISGICMSMIVKLNRNLHRYGIEIMNGQSVYTILTAFLLEMILVMGGRTAAQYLAVYESDPQQPHVSCCTLVPGRHGGTYCIHGIYPETQKSGHRKNYKE